MVKQCCSHVFFLFFYLQTYSKDCKFVLDKVAVEEHVEVYQNENRTEISVPKFDDNDEATFVHDFRLVSCHVIQIMHNSVLLCYQHHIVIVWC